MFAAKAHRETGPVGFVLLAQSQEQAPSFLLQRCSGHPITHFISSGLVKVANCF